MWDWCFGTRPARRSLTPSPRPTTAVPKLAWLPSPRRTEPRSTPSRSGRERWRMSADTSPWFSYKTKLTFYMNRKWTSKWKWEVEEIRWKKNSFSTHNTSEGRKKCSFAANRFSKNRLHMAKKALAKPRSLLFNVYKMFLSCFQNVQNAVNILPKNISLSRVNGPHNLRMTSEVQFMITLFTRTRRRFPLFLFSCLPIVGSFTEFKAAKSHQISRNTFF